MENSLVDRIENLAIEGRDGSPENYELWRERSRAALVEHYGSDDHPEVSRFFRTLSPRVAHSDYTVRSGEFDAAKQEATREAAVILSVLAESLRGSAPKDEPKGTLTAPPGGRSVFLVHGRDRIAVSAMKAFLRTLDLHIVDWEEAVAETGEPTPYVGDVVEAGLRMADAAVVFLTPDDLVRLRPEFLTDHDPEDERVERGQPRPNVVFEWGYAYSMAKERCVVVALRPMKLHSDIGGRHVVYLDATPESRSRLVQRLRLARLEVRDTGSDWLSAGQFPEYENLVNGGSESEEDSTEDADAEEPPGFLEIFVEMEDAFPRLMDTMNQISEIVTGIGDLSKRSTARVQQSDARGAGSKGRLSIALDFAARLKEPADQIDDLVARYEADLDHVAAGVDYIMGQIETRELSQEETGVARDFVARQIELGLSTDGALDQLVGLLEALETLESMARPVKTQVSRIRLALERFFDASSKIQTWAERASRSDFADTGEGE